MLPRRRFLLSLILRVPAGLVVWALAMAFPAPCQGQRCGPVKILLLADEAQSSSQLLLDTLSAHLADYDVEVQIGAPLSQTVPLPEQVDRVRAVIDDSGALAAVWVDPVGRRVQMLTFEWAGGGDTAPSLENEHLVVRTLPVDSRGWRSDCEAIAAIVRAALSPRLVRRQDRSKDAKRARSVLVIQALDAETQQLSPMSYLHCPTPPEPYLFTSVYPALEGSFVSPNRDPMFGGSTTIGVSYKELLGLRVSAGFLGSFDDDRLVRVERFPLRVGLAGTLPWRRLGVGLGLDAILDFTRWIGSDPTQTNQDTAQTFGFGAALLVQVRILPGVHFQAEGGVDLYNRRMRYLFRSESIFEYMPLQPRFRAGVAFGVPVAYRDKK